MKHDFLKDSTSEKAELFREWLETETINALKRDYGNGDAFKSTIFLFVNRAYEAHMSDSEIMQIFGRSVAKAGFPEEMDDVILSWLETFADIAKKVHSPQ